MKGRTIAPGRIEGFLSGCPFCASQRIGIPEIGSRFRIIRGTYYGATGTVVKWPDRLAYIPGEFLAQMDHEPPELQICVSLERQMIQLLPFPNVPAWAPPLSMSDAGEIDQPIVTFCERSFSKGRWKTDWDSFQEVVRISWHKRLPIQTEELWEVLRAHGVPGRAKAEIIDFFEKGRRLLIYCFNRKPIRKKRVEPFFLET